MDKDIVIGIDSSTQSTKSIAWSRDGDALAEGRAPTPMSTPRPGWFEQDPEDWWSAAARTLRDVAAHVDPARVAGIAISNQRETVAFVDGDGRPTRPAMVWLDERGRGEIDRMRGEIDLDEVHRVTGKPPDLTPVVYRLSWLHHHARTDLDGADKITDAHAFLAGRLTGRITSSWTSADPFGVMDIAAKAWWPEVLAHLELTADQFAELARPGQAIGALTPEAAAATGLAEGTPLFAAGGDGQCAGLGVNAARPGVVYLNLGTALITGAWAAEPMTGTAWRTMTSPTGEGYFLEGCQRAGAFLVNWVIDTFAGGRDDPAVFARLEEEAARLPIGSDGVAICPHLTGCMDPHWDPSARGTIDGLGPQHGLGHIYRATLEALTLESARCIEAMRAHGLAPEKIVAVGGGGNSALWTKMFADATGLPLHVSNSLEASALGAGMSAAVGAGWFDGFDAAAEAMSGMGPAIAPDPSVRAAWDAASVRQAATYRPSIRPA
ncbi:MAG: FGGY-family carbohydrate kinase [Pseudomonadota bacterium]